MSSRSASIAVERILSQLELAEWQEPNPSFQADYRIAWITLLRASRGEHAAHVSATYAVIGLHPDKVWDAIVERRKALLGPLYENFFGVQLPPKMPARSVRALPQRADRAA